MLWLPLQLELLLPPLPFLELSEVDGLYAFAGDTLASSAFIPLLLLAMPLSPALDQLLGQPRLLVSLLLLMAAMGLDRYRWWNWIFIYGIRCLGLWLRWREGSIVASGFAASASSRTGSGSGYPTGS